MKIERLLDMACFIFVSLAIYFVFIYAPTEKVMGIVQKIFYFHVASAWIAFFGFFVTFICSIALFITNRYIFDDIASASAEIGLVFCTIVLVTGPIWAKPIWGTWWTWDPRLTTTLILWFIYIGYMMLRNFVDEEDKRAKFSAALGIIGFIDVPIVFLSIRWWRTIHPNVLQKGGGGLAPEMITTLLISVVAFSLLYAVLMVKTLKVKKLEKILSQLEK